MRALLVNDASLAGHHGSALVTEEIVQLAAEAGIEVQPGWDWTAVERSIGDGEGGFDLLLINGEGSLHDDSRSALRIAALAKAAAERGLPAYLINASEEANGPEVHDGLRACRLRFVRDTASQASLGRAGLSSTVVPDLTLSSSAAPRARATGSLLVTDASEEAKTARMMRLASKWPDTRMISFRARPPWPVRGGRARRIGYETKRIFARLGPLSPWSLRYGGPLPSRAAMVDLFLSSARGIVCARYHAVCFALRTGLPFIAVEGNIGKVGALLSDVGLTSRLARMDELEDAGAPPIVPPFSTEEADRIALFLANAEASAHRMFGAIAADANP